MTKAWESKSVESQVQDSQAKGSARSGAKLTPGEAETRRRREILILSRSSVERDLQSSQNQRYRDHLARALSDIEAQIRELDATLDGKR